MPPADNLLGATETAVIVPVPAAEPVVGPYRRILDHAAAWGVPAHITVLYPFIPPDRIVESTIDGLRAALCSVGAFECVFSQAKWFGEDLVWLAPEPDTPFRALTGAVWRQFPDHPPYGGAHPDTIPHLTVGSRRVGDIAGMKQAAAGMQAKLPITAWIDHVRLIAGTDAPGSWRTVTEFALSVE